MPPNIQILEDGNPGRTKGLHDQIEIDRSMYHQHPEKIQKYRQFAAGEFKLQITDNQKEILEGLIQEDFCDNICHVIISEDADRIKLQRFECDDDAAEKWLELWWSKVGLSDRSGEVHYDTLMDGNHAVALDWDPERQQVVLNREPWWDGNTGVFVAYDLYGNPLYAVKQWYSSLGIHREVWWEDRLEKYINSVGGSSWFPYTEATDTDWPAAWTKTGTREGDPLHIPIIHFPNSGRGFKNYGRSEISGGVTGFQLQINDLHYDMSAAGRFAGYQVLWTKGKQQRDANNNIISPKYGPGQMLVTEDTDAEFGAIPAGGSDKLIDLYMTKCRAVARMTRTPLHTIVGAEWPSGEALYRAEIPLVNKVARQIEKFFYRWVMVAHRATEIQNAFGGGQLNEDALIRASFGNPERRDLLSLSNVVKNAEDALSPQAQLRILGYSPTEIDEIMEEKKQQQETMGAMALQGFNRGTGPGTQLPRPAASGNGRTS